MGPFVLGVTRFPATTGTLGGGLLRADKPLKGNAERVSAQQVEGSERESS